MLPVAIPVCLCGDGCLRPDLGASRYYPGLFVAPERDQQLARQRHDHRLLDGALAAGGPLAVPPDQSGVGLERITPWLNPAIGSTMT